MKSITTTDFQISPNSSLEEQIEHTSEERSGNQDKNAISDEIILPSSVSKADNTSPGMKKYEMNMERLLVKHTSHALLYVPEHRRISGTSENSMTSSCPPVESVLHINPMTRFASLLRPPVFDSHRRRSIHIGAPAIAFTNQKLCQRRGSHSTIALQHDTMESEPLVESTLLHRIKDNVKTMPEGRNAQSGVMQQALPESNISEISLSQCLTKRVSWLSMKNLQEDELSIGTAAINKRNRRHSTIFDLGNEPLSSKNQFGSMSQLDRSSLLDKETDTPPLDTLSWSNAGSYSPLLLLLLTNSSLRSLNADIQLKIFVEFWIDTDS